MSKGYKELIYDEVVRVLNLNSSDIKFEGGYIIQVYGNKPTVVDYSSLNEFDYKRIDTIPVSEEISQETPSVHQADRSDYIMQYKIMFKSNRKDEVLLSLKEFRDYFFTNKQKVIDGYTTSFKTSRGDKQGDIMIQGGAFYSFYTLKVFLTAIKDGYIWKDTDSWQMRLNSIPAVDIVAGETYTIKTAGTTDFTTVGATDNNIGTTFTALGTPTGTGTVTQSYETLKLDIDIFANKGNPEFSNKAGKGLGIVSNTTSNDKLRIFYNGTNVEKKIYAWIQNKLSKDTLFDLIHTFDGETFEYTALITGGARTRTDNGVAILEFDWAEADV